MRILLLGVTSPPEAFLERKIEALLRAGVELTSAPRVDAAQIRRFRPDIVHCEWNSAAIDALPEPSVWHYPVVISCRGTQLRIRPHVTPGYADALRETFERARAVHCVCETIRNEAVALGLDPQKAEVIFPAVDERRFTPPANRPGSSSVRLIAVGSLIWTKGYEYALLTLRALLDRDVDARLEIIGDGNERQRVLFTVNDLGLTHRVTLQRTVPPEQVREAMQRSDLFLHSSLSEGISNAALEAMACGLPVVTSDGGGMKEAVHDGIEGFVVPLRDPVAAADAVAKLARDPALRARMGRAGRARVESTFRLDEQIARYIALYERVAGATVSA
jgi:colanic acid/amylovoran biosynthesis glycosyltransferase